MSSDENCIEILEPDLCSICEDSNIVTIVICHLSPNGRHNFGVFGVAPIPLNPDY